MNATVTSVPTAAYEYGDFMAKLGLSIKPTAATANRIGNQLSTVADATAVVKEGGRNSELTSIGGSLRRRGATPDVILEFLRAHNQAKCSPPLDEAEVERIVESLSRYEPATNDDVQATLTDTGNAERFARDWAADVRYVPKWKKWLLWDNGRWRLDDTNRILELAKETAKRIYEEGVSLTDDKLRGLVAKHSSKSQQADRLKAMIHLGSSVPALVVDAAQLDADPMLLGVGNGTLDLRTGLLREARREDLMTKQSPVRFDPEAACPRFELFLQEAMGGNQELVDYLRRMVGYCLTGLTDEQCLFFCYGGGANGKTTFLNVIKDLLSADYCKSTASDTLMVKRNGRGASNDVARLLGARAVLSNEVEEGARLSEALIKEMTGGDEVTARFLYGEFFEFRPQFKLVIAGNHQPVIRGDDTGIWRRLHIVPFTVTIPKEKRDPKLPEALRTELSGILNWALKGCQEWQKQGLKTPPVMQTAVDDYKSEMDILGQWSEECCVSGETHKIQASLAYDNYRVWAMRNGLNPLSGNSFGRRMRERHQSVKTNSGRVYVGLGPKP